MLHLLEVDNQIDITNLNERLSDLEEEWFMLLFPNETILPFYIEEINKTIETINTNVALITCDVLRKITFQNENIIQRKIRPSDRKKYFNDLKQSLMQSGWVFNKNWFLKVEKFSNESTFLSNYVNKLLSNHCSFKHFRQFGILRTESWENENVTC